MPLQAGFYLSVFVRGARPKTLPAVIMPILMASAWAWRKTSLFDGGIFFLTLFAGIFLQCALNFFNDALDFQSGLDGPGRKGPPRLAQTGALPAQQVRRLGFFCLLLAFLAGIPLMLRGGWPAAALGMASMALTWLYSGSPYSLSRTGGSELAVFLFFGLGAAGGTYWLQALSWDSSLLYLGIQCGLWPLSILLVNYLRDGDEDKKAGRKNIVTVYGRGAALLSLAVIQMFVYLLCFYWLGLGLKGGAFSFFLLPLSAGAVYYICVSPPSSKHNQYLFWISALYTAFGGLWMAGLLL